MAAAGAFILMAGAAAGACAPGGDTQVRDLVAEGRTAYASNGCVACHGPDGHGDGTLAPISKPVPTDFHDPSGFATARTASAIAEVIGEGIAATPTPMPAYAHLDADTRDAMAAYILSLGDGAASPIRLEDAWARVPLGTTGRTAAYAVAVNDSTAPVTLVSAESPMAASVEFHEMSMESSFMRMRHVDDITVPAKGRVVFEPSGRHLMVLGLTQRLESGDRLPLIVATDDGRALRVDVPVRPAEPAP